MVKSNYFCDLFVAPEPLFKSRLKAIDSLVIPTEDASNDLPTKTSWQKKSTARVSVYQICLDGENITAIDSTGATYDQFIKGVNARFGSDRVGKIERV